jgi:hypothetical protein
MRKPTILVEPITVPTLDAVVVTGLPLEGVSVTVTAAGEMVPLGKPEPVTETLVTPGCPEAGLADALSLTLVCAKAGTDINTATRNERTVFRIALMPLCP